jgi:hypothetical protein
MDLQPVNTLATTIQPAEDPNSTAFTRTRSGPTVLRMLVGAHLRWLREASGITREMAGYAIRATPSKISRLERGRTGFKMRDLIDLLILYGVTDESERATLLSLAEQANVPGWWHTYSDVVPTWFEPFLGLEQAAADIRSYEIQFVPALLQTAEYARAAIKLGNPDDTADQIERRVELLVERQAILHRPDPPTVWAVIDEAALRRPIGGIATMCAQLEHLIELAKLPHVTVQVVPFSVGGHAAAGGPITILRFTEHQLSDVVYLEQLISAVYLEHPPDVEHYTKVMWRLCLNAEQPSVSTSVLRRILKDFQ